MKAIIDGLTILLKDETIIRLASLDLPGAPGDPDNIHAIAAREALAEALPEGTQVILYQTRKAKIGRENRMGHALAHLVTKKGALWVNGMMAEKGVARVFPTSTNAELTEDLFALEDKAIQNRTGLWADGAAPLLTPESAEQALGRVGVVQGRVQGAATVRNNLYLNFGANWKTDFTVMVPPALRKKLARAGIDPMSLKDQTIRARGFIRSYNGPFLELAHESHLQIIEDDSVPLQPQTEIPTIDPNP